MVSTESAESLAKSDHRIMRLFKEHKRGGPQPFRFKLFWLEKTDLIIHRETWWRECDTAGNAGYVMAKKLNYLKEKLKSWAKENFERLETCINKWESIITDLEALDKVFGLNEQEQQDRREAELKLNEAVQDQHRFWSQRAHRLWIKKGDKGSSFFHNVVNSRAANKNIEGLIIDGKFQRDEDLCKNHLVDFYKNLYTETFNLRPRLDGINFKSLS